MLSTNTNLGLSSFTCRPPADAPASGRGETGDARAGAGAGPSAERTVSSPFTPPGGERPVHHLVLHHPHHHHSLADLVRQPLPEGATCGKPPQGGGETPAPSSGDRPPQLLHHHHHRGFLARIVESFQAAREARAEASPTSPFTPPAEVKPHFHLHRHHHKGFLARAVESFRAAREARAEASPTSPFTPPAEVKPHHHHHHHHHHGLFHKIGHAIGHAFKKVMESPLLAKVMTVAQFIPIPIVQVAARVYNVARSVYAAAQGIAHGSIAGVLGGVAGIAGGVANVGGMLGASTRFVQGAERIASYAGMASRGYAALATGDFRQAAGLAAAAFGGTGAAPVLQQVDRAVFAVDALRRGDLVGAAGAGADLLGALPGADDGALKTGATRVGAIADAIGAVREGRYQDAAGLVLDGYGGALGLDAKAQEKVRDVAGAFDSVASAGALLARNDFAGAASVLLDTASRFEPDAAARGSLQKAAGTAGEVHAMIDAFRQGDLDGAGGRALALLGEPLDRDTRAVVLDVLQRADGGATARPDPSVLAAA